MLGKTPLPEKLFQSPELYMVDFHDGEASFAKMTRETYSRSIFTDRSRICTASAERIILSMEELVSARKSLKTAPRRINFLFHTANCGSTLLSRALDLPGRTIGYREPFSLRQLGAEAARINFKKRDYQDWARRLELVLILLGRRYSEEEVPIVKTNIPVNFILPEVLSRNPDHKAIFLYSTLENFLISVLKAPERRNWVTSVSQELLGGIRAIEELSNFNLAGASVPMIAATLWVAQMVKLNELVGKFSGLRTLESNQFFQHTEDTLYHLAKLFEIDLGRAEISTIATCELFSRHSKKPAVRYNVDTREAVRIRAITEFGIELNEGMHCGLSLMEQCKIPETVPNALF